MDRPRLTATFNIGSTERPREDGHHKWSVINGRGRANSAEIIYFIGSLDDNTNKERLSEPKQNIICYNGVHTQLYVYE